MHIYARTRVSIGLKFTRWRFIACDEANCKYKIFASFFLFLFHSWNYFYAAPYQVTICVNACIKKIKNIKIENLEYYFFGLLI